MSFLDMFSGLTGQMSTDMAIDLGTANTLVAIPGEGIVVNEPSVVAIEKATHRVLAVGHEAKNMINHTPEAFSAEHPLHDGVVADYDVTEAMISAFISKAAPRKYPWQAKPRIVICIPCGATSVEKRAVFEAAVQAGARQAYLIEEPMAAAMGADLPVTEQPKEVTIQSEDVRSALVQPCEEMVVHIKETFKKTNPDLASDIIQNGILLTGGGGLLSGLDRYLTDKLEIPVWTSETALTNVVMGCLKVLETPTALKQTLMRSK